MWVSDLRKTSPCLIGFVSELQSQALRSFLYFFFFLVLTPLPSLFSLLDLSHVKCSYSYHLPSLCHPILFLFLNYSNFTSHPALPCLSYAAGTLPIPRLGRLLLFTLLLSHSMAEISIHPRYSLLPGRNSDIPFCRNPPSCQIPEMFGFRSLAYFKARRIYPGDTLKSC